MAYKIAIIDDDKSIRDSLSQMLELLDYEVVSFQNAHSFFKQDLNFFDCFLIDIKMPGMSGIEVLENLLRKNIDVPSIIITGHGDINLAIESMKKGAYDFHEKPFEKDRLINSISHAIEKKNLSKERDLLQSELEKIKQESYGILGTSNAIKQVHKKISQYQNTPASILITGETGTGKELVAKALYKNSDRSNENFVVINAATLLESTYYSEIFGHEKGSFTGAINTHKGKLEYANKGTVFFDEIDSIPQNMQAVLLRVLEGESFTRLGGNQAIKVDVRFIFATNQNLVALVEKGSFRKDLFYRINILNIHVSPLRERIPDISVVVNHFLHQFCEFYHRELLHISDLIMQKIKRHEWPGNVRELKNIIENMVLSCEGETIMDWPIDSFKESTDIAQNSLKIVMENFEQKHISIILEKHNGNLKAVAEELDIIPRTLFGKMKKFALKKEDYKKQ